MILPCGAGIIGHAAHSGKVATGGWTARDSDDTSQSTYNFGSSAIGTAAADRYVYCCYTGRGSNGVPTGITCGGVAMTAMYFGPAASCPISWFGLLVAAGTTATFIATLPGVEADGGIMIFNGYGLSNPLSPLWIYDSGVSAGTSYSFMPPAPIGSLVMAAISATIPSATTTTWSGVAETSDSTYDSALHLHSAAFLIPTALNAIGVASQVTISQTPGNFRASAIIIE